MNKKEKEELNKLCKCGHTRGKHTYFQGSFCTYINSCGCKRFEELQKLKEKDGKN